MELSFIGISNTKKDGVQRPVINTKNLNKFVQLKMEGIPPASRSGLHACSNVFRSSKLGGSVDTV